MPSRICGHGFLVDPREYTQAFRQLGRDGSWGGAVGLLVEMPYRGVEMNILVGSAAITSLERCSQWASCLQLLYSLASPAGQELDIVACGATLAALQRRGRWALATQQVDQMRGDGTRPNAVTCGAVLGACATPGGRRWAWALRWWGEALSQGTEADVRRGSAVMGACEQGRQWTRAVVLVRGFLQRHALEVDAVVYNIAVAALARGRCWLRTLPLLRALRLDASEADLVSYGAASNSCGEVGNVWRKSAELLAEAMRRGIQPNTIATNTVVNACEKMREWEQVSKCLLAARHSGVPRDTISHNVATSAYGRGHQWELSLCFLGEVARTDGEGEPDVLSCNSAITACTNGQQWQQAAQVFRSMRPFAGEPDVISFDASITSCSLGHQWEHAS